MTHATLDVVDIPALAIDRHNRDLRPGDIAAVFQNAVAAHDILMHPATLYALLAHLDLTRGRQHVFKFWIVNEVFLAIAGFFAVDGSERADQFRCFFNAENLGDKHHVRR